ncbi:cation:proton antiporter [Ramlibacter rhizophilus]|uniref:Sodium:proton exchanger n=1 Tax=Ramlibacter rhizophilus TaxID=1781167 RepID=A0A4Z0BZZ9_9BURK|nr:cation:proton antiporter [Ramlibacter rhizophilus]TFZ04252.1 sodium:proton exchanger [Ramlibacter rhizophilus]
MNHAFAQIAALLLVSACTAALLTRLRQPVLIAYILVGIAVGPAGLDLVTAHEEVELLAQVGVAVLLFAVGLKLDLEHVRHIGPVALATGLGQLAFTIAVGFGLVLALGQGPIDALYIAVALTFSSTIIIVKLLSDKHELDSLHGRIAVGFLIVQDLAVVIAMMAMSTMRGPAEDAVGLGAVLFSLSWRLVLAAVLLFVAMKWLLPRLVAVMAKSPELLLLFAIAWGVGLAALGEWAGFSREAGAFLAGFSLASTPYREAMAARLSGIRDFLLLFFFLDLGARLDLSLLGAQLLPSLVLSAFVLIGNPLIVMAIMGFMGYRRRTGFLAGLTVAQISEFSIVFVAMGISLGHIGDAALGITTLVGLVTITVSTYMILYSQPLYARLAPWLGVFERRHPYREQDGERGPSESLLAPQVLVFGQGRYGSRLLRQMQGAGVRVLGVDFDPDVVRGLQAQQLPVRYGDAEDMEFVQTLPLAQAQWVAIALPDWPSTHILLKALEAAGYSGRLAAAARDAQHHEHLARTRIDRILNPFDDAADHAAQYLREQLGAGR